MVGVVAFLFSTFTVTLFGEIIPQAYLAKHALKASVILVPIIRFYQMLLYPFAKPTGIILDHWLGKEKVSYFNEKEVLVLLRQHAQSGNSDISHLESIGAANFLALDDILIKDEGEVLNPKSIIALSTNKQGLPIFPKFNRSNDNKFLQKVHASGEKWVVITNESKKPLYVLNADQFLRDALDVECAKSIYTYCHRPIVVKKGKMNLGEVLLGFKVRAESPEDDVVDNDIILYWGLKEKRIITGADVLGRLLRGIVPRG
jgi:CBS domain containing-hemolysin-like protein